MIKKIILLALILAVLYGTSVFMMPEVSSKVDNLIGMPWLSDTLRGWKENFDGAVTDIPSIDNVLTGYEDALKGARDAQEKFTQWVDATKDAIDTVRWGAQKAEEVYEGAKETYDQAKETYDQAKEVLDSVSGKIDDIQKIAEDVKQLTGTGS